MFYFFCCFLIKEFFFMKIEKRRKTGGMPLKNKKKKQKSYSNRYDINTIREMEKEVFYLIKILKTLFFQAASIIQVFYRYHLRKKKNNSSKIKCHKASQVEIDLLFPAGAVQNLNKFLKVNNYL